MLKASTGYAYARIQRDSTAIARSLARYGHPFRLPPVRRRHRFLDAVLLDVLAHEPARLQEAFGRLFDRNPGDRIMRFLDEDTSLAQEVRLVATLPPAPFVRAAARWSARRLPAVRQDAPDLHGWGGRHGMGSVARRRSYR